MVLSEGGINLEGPAACGRERVPLGPVASEALEGYQERGG